MTSKAESVGMGVLGLGAALAVNRYNDEYRGTLNVIRIISNTEPNLRTSEAFRLCDNIRIMSSEKDPRPSDESIREEMLITDYMNKVVEGGYSSQKLSGAQSDESDTEYLCDSNAPTSTTIVESVCGDCESELTGSEEAMNTFNCKVIRRNFANIMLKSN
ncbi:hypothetical protein LOD99_4734 [Oopsacas minuta]|uniref:Uncharacterized protein n=1 Tax=Oopsacas minuta TaxID=111878 RepID=A0AAV7JSZ1_9METZ|nr:hypothetical protein LOD99_4734 [Oopsacas minuta]